MPFVGLIVAIAAAAAAAAAIGWLARPLPVDPKRRQALTDAVAAVDRELAANLELMTMFDQTRQAVVLENGEFARHRETIEHEAGDIVSAVTTLYARIPEAEAAMERRGPANSLRDEDRRLIEAWEGDAREAQRTLRRSLDALPPSGWHAVTARLRSRSPHR
jgi:hypothetical protein